MGDEAAAAPAAGYAEAQPAEAPPAPGRVNKNAHNIGNEGFWTKNLPEDPSYQISLPEDVYQAYGSRGASMLLPYEMKDPCGFRASEIHDFIWSFKLGDILGEKQVSAKDARTALKRLGDVPNDAQWLEAINLVDPYARGMLDFQKFLRLATYFITPLITEDELVKAFKTFDRDQSGSIDAIELRDMFVKLGFQLTPLEAYNMLEEADDGGDGEVSYQEFVDKILKSR